MSESIKKFIQKNVKVSQSDKDKVSITILEDMKDQVKDKLLDEASFQWEDITDAYLEGKRQLYLKGRTLIEAFIDEPRTGKSTIAQASSYEDNMYILRYKEDSTIPKKGDITLFPLICQTPDEFIRIAKRQELKQVAIVLDEGSSPIEQTGLSSSTDQAYLKYIRQICAEKGLHVKIASPDSIASDGALLIHHILGVSKKDGITKTKLYYNDMHEGRKIPLGIVTWDVNEIINKHWYELYGKKKTFAYELVLSGKIRSIRDLEFSLIVLIAFEHSKKLLDSGIRDPDVLSIRVDSAMKELSHLYSYIAKEELVSKLRALASCKVKEAEAEYQLNRENRMKPLGEIEKKRLEMIRQSCKEGLIQQLTEYRNLIKLYVEYLSIGDNFILQDVMKLCNKYNFLESEIDE